MDDLGVPLFLETSISHQKSRLKMIFPFPKIGYVIGNQGTGKLVEIQSYREMNFIARRKGAPRPILKLNHQVHVGGCIYLLHLFVGK